MKFNNQDTKSTKKTSLTKKRPEKRLFEDNTDSETDGLESVNSNDSTELDELESVNSNDSRRNLHPFSRRSAFYDEDESEISSVNSGVKIHLGSLTPYNSKSRTSDDDDEISLFSAPVRHQQSNKKQKESLFDSLEFTAEKALTPYKDEKSGDYHFKAEEAQEHGYVKETAVNGKYKYEVVPENPEDPELVYSMKIPRLNEDGTHSTTEFDELLLDHKGELLSYKLGKGTSQLDKEWLDAKLAIFNQEQIQPPVMNKSARSAQQFVAPVQEPYQKERRARIPSLHDTPTSVMNFPNENYVYNSTKGLSKKAQKNNLQTIKPFQNLNPAGNNGTVQNAANNKNSRLGTGLGAGLGEGQGPGKGLGAGQGSGNNKYTTLIKTGGLPTQDTELLNRQKILEAELKQLTKALKDSKAREGQLSLNLLDKQKIELETELAGIKKLLSTRFNDSTILPQANGLTGSIAAEEEKRLRDQLAALVANQAEFEANKLEMDRLRALKDSQPPLTGGAGGPKVGEEDQTELLKKIAALEAKNALLVSPTANRTSADQSGGSSDGPGLDQGAGGFNEDAGIFKIEIAKLKEQLAALAEKQKGQGKESGEDQSGKASKVKKKVTFSLPEVDGSNANRGQGGKAGKGEGDGRGGVLTAEETQRLQDKLVTLNADQEKFRKNQEDIKRLTRELELALARRDGEGKGEGTNDNNQELLSKIAELEEANKTLLAKQKGQGSSDIIAGTGIGNFTENANPFKEKIKILEEKIKILETQINDQRNQQSGSGDGAEGTVGVGSGSGMSGALSDIISKIENNAAEIKEKGLITVLEGIIVSEEDKKVLDIIKGIIAADTTKNPTKPPEERILDLINALKKVADSNKGIEDVSQELKMLNRDKRLLALMAKSKKLTLNDAIISETEKRRLLSEEKLAQKAREEAKLREEAERKAKELAAQKLKDETKPLEKSDLSIIFDADTLRPRVYGFRDYKGDPKPNTDDIITQKFLTEAGKSGNPKALELLAQVAALSPVIVKQENISAIGNTPSPTAGGGLLGGLKLRGGAPTGQPMVVLRAKAKTLTEEHVNELTSGLIELIKSGPEIWAREREAIDGALVQYNAANDQLKEVQKKCAKITRLASGSKNITNDLSILQAKQKANEILISNIELDLSNNKEVLTQKRLTTTLLKQKEDQVGLKEQIEKLKKDLILFNDEVRRLPELLTDIPELTPEEQAKDPIKSYRESKDLEVRLNKFKAIAELEHKRVALALEEKVSHLIDTQKSITQAITTIVKTANKETVLAEIAIFSNNSSQKQASTELTATLNQASSAVNKELLDKAIRLADLTKVMTIPTNTRVIEKKAAVEKISFSMDHFQESEAVTAAKNDVEKKISANQLAQTEREKAKKAAEAAGSYDDQAKLVDSTAREREKFELSELNNYLAQHILIQGAREVVKLEKIQAALKKEGLISPHIKPYAEAVGNYFLGLNKDGKTLGAVFKVALENARQEDSTPITKEEAEQALELLKRTAGSGQGFEHVNEAEYNQARIPVNLEVPIDRPIAKEKGKKTSTLKEETKQIFVIKNNESGGPTIEKGQIALWVKEEQIYRKSGEVIEKIELAEEDKAIIVELSKKATNNTKKIKVDGKLVDAISQAQVIHPSLEEIEADKRESTTQLRKEMVIVSRKLKRQLKSIEEKTVTYESAKELYEVNKKIYEDIKLNLKKNEGLSDDLSSKLPGLDEGEKSKSLIESYRNQQDLEKRSEKFHEDFKLKFNQDTAPFKQEILTLKHIQNETKNEIKTLLAKGANIAEIPKEEIDKFDSVQKSLKNSGVSEFNIATLIENTVTKPKKLVPKEVKFLVEHLDLGVIEKNNPNREEVIIILAAKEIAKLEKMQTSINERGLISPDLNSYILLAKKYFESKEAFGFALNEAIKNDKSDKPEVKKIIEELTKLQEKCLLDDKVGFKLYKDTDHTLGKKDITKLKEYISLSTAEILAKRLASNSVNLSTSGPILMIEDAEAGVKSALLKDQQYKENLKKFEASRPIRKPEIKKMIKKLTDPPEILITNPAVGGKRSPDATPNKEDFKYKSPNRNGDSTKGRTV